MALSRTWILLTIVVYVDIFKASALRCYECSSAEACKKVGETGEGCKKEKATCIKECETDENALEGSILCMTGYTNDIIDFRACESQHKDDWVMNKDKPVANCPPAKGLSLPDNICYCETDLCNGETPGCCQHAFLPKPNDDEWF